MKIVSYFELAFKNINRRALRAFFTILGIFLASVFMIYIISITCVVNGLEQGETSKIQGVNTKIIEVIPFNGGGFSSGMNSLNSINLKKINSINGVSFTIPAINAVLPNAEINNKIINKPFNITGISTYQHINDAVRLVYGTSNTNGVIINENTLKKIGINNYKDIVGKKLKLTVDNINGVKVATKDYVYNITGIFDSKEYGDFILNSKDVAMILGNIDNIPDLISNVGYEKDYVYVKNLNQLNSIQKNINNLGFASTSINNKIQQVKQSIGRYNTLAIIILICIILISALGIINTLGASIFERRKSIGIMKAIGASNSDIYIMTIIEAISIGLIGSVIGVLFSTFTFNNVLNASGLPKGAIDAYGAYRIEIWIFVIIFMVFISFIAGVYPARKAMKISTTECLRK